MPQPGLQCRAVLRMVRHNGCQEVRPYIVRRGAVRRGVTQGAQVDRVVNTCFLGVAHAVEQRATKRLHLEGLLFMQGAPSFLRQCTEDMNHRPGNRKIRRGALLHVEHPDFDSVSFEAGNRAARVRPLVAQDAAGVVRFGLSI